MIRGATIIMIFYVLGFILNHIIADIMPSSVCGMILLFLALQLKIIKPKHVEKTANMITKNMAIFFVPVGVSIMAYYDIITRNLATLLVVSIVSTILVILSVGTVQQYLEKQSKK